MNRIIHAGNALPVVFLFLSASVGAVASAATFVDRQQPDDLRVVSFNKYATPTDRFARIITALDPDVIALQEWRVSASVFNSRYPLPNGDPWYVVSASSGVIASRYPLDGVGFDGVTVDLPNDRYPTDLHVMNNHFRCCNVTDPPAPDDAYERTRQRQADSRVAWMRELRTAGSSVALTAKTPMLLVGDLNIINEPDLYDPLGTLLTGDIFDESRYGADSPPDWDGTSLADAHPLQNGRGPEDYTWRDDLLPFEPGRLDYILYTDSVLEVANRFVLNTVSMTPEELAETGLQPYDVTFDDVGATFDHLPVVADFRWRQVPEPSSCALAAVLAACSAMSLRRRS